MPQPKRNLIGDSASDKYRFSSGRLCLKGCAWSVIQSSALFRKSYLYEIVINTYFWKTDASERLIGFWVRNPWQENPSWLLPCVWLSWRVPWLLPEPYRGSLRILEPKPREHNRASACATDLARSLRKLRPNQTSFSWIIRSGPLI